MGKIKTERQGGRLPTLPSNKGDDTYLSADSKKMMRQQRMLEQQGHRHLARVNAREHPDEPRESSGLEAGMEGLQGHPYLDRQIFDGADPNLSANPPNDPKAREEWRQERENDLQNRLERQHKLGHQPRSTPTPRPG